MTVKLKIEPCGAQPFEHILDEPTLLIGRSSGANLSIQDQALSRRHATLYYEDECLFIKDLNSHNGTRVDGRPIIKPFSLAEGSVIEVGESRITVWGLQKELKPDSAVSVRFREGAELGHTLYVPASKLLVSSETDLEAPGTGTQGSSRFTQRLKLLNEIHHKLSQAIGRDELLEQVIDWVFENLNPEESTVFLKDDAGTLVAVISRTRSGGSRELVYSTHLVQEVVEKGNVALVYDTELDERFTGAMSIISSGVRSLIAAPLSDEKGCLGMVVLNSQATVRSFSEEDMEILVSITSVAALRLRNLALAADAVQRQRMEEELALARRIQMALLPSGIPDIDGYSIYGENTPSQGVSGDYFQIIERLGNRECVFLVADVAGKGIAASLVTASLEALAAAPIEDGRSPEDICQKLSRMLLRRTPPEKYATLFLAILDCETGRIDYTNAGHNPAILVRRDGALSYLENTGLPIGLLARGHYEAGTVTLAPGDLLVMYTDGITEPFDAQGEEYGMERLSEVCKEYREMDLEELAEHIHEGLAAFTDVRPYPDDQTMVMVRRKLEGREGGAPSS